MTNRSNLTAAPRRGFNLAEAQRRELRSYLNAPADTYRTEFPSCERSADFGI